MQKKCRYTSKLSYNFPENLYYRTVEHQNAKRVIYKVTGKQYKKITTME